MQPRDLALRRAGLQGAPSAAKMRYAPACAFFGVGVVMLLYLVRPAAPARVSRDSGSAAVLVETQDLNERLAALESMAEQAAVRQPPRAESFAPPPPLTVITPSMSANAEVVRQPLPNCSVVFFHHLEKTAGTTLRSILQRHAQLGLFDFFSFVNRFNKIQFQMVTHRLDTLIRDNGLAGLRLAVEIHIGGGGYEQFMKYTLPDLLYLRSKLRAAGCRCNLVTLLRHPLMQHISWHHHFVNHRVPLCFWNNPHDCQTRMAMALACHGGPSIRPLQEEHHKAVRAMWAAFDLVGVTERFDEFLLLLTDLIGLQAPAYRAQLYTAQTAAAREAAIRWTQRSCASLTADPPSALLKYVRKRMDESGKAAAEHRRRRGTGDSRGPPGMMDCAGYGPCDVPGLTRAQTTQYTWYEPSQCEAVTEQAVLQRLCARMAVDEPLYRVAREGFDARVLAAGASLESRVARLNEAGAALAAQSEKQAALDQDALALAAGTRLQRAYRASSGGGAPWVVDEHAPWYRPHERARLSCVNCSGDVVPEFDLAGCWPLWTQFGPDELRFRCTRHWTADPGRNHPRDYLKARSTEAMPCWQTCWEPIQPGSEAHRETGVMSMAALDAAARVDPRLSGRHCTAPCPTAEAGGAEPAVNWRRRWDRELATFMAANEAARELVRLTDFIRPLPSADFMFGVF